MFYMGAALDREISGYTNRFRPGPGGVGADEVDLEIVGGVKEPRAAELG
jgi:hypothetical protein